VKGPCRADRKIGKTPSQIEYREFVRAKTKVGGGIEHLFGEGGKQRGLGGAVVAIVVL